jgi:S1-C subfamily serine protease
MAESTPGFCEGGTVQICWRLLSRFALAVVAALATAGGAAAQLSLDADIVNVRGWDVGYTKTMNGCVATAKFTDGTEVWTGFSQKYGAFLAFTNDKWQSINPNGNYQLDVRAQGYGVWRGAFAGFAQGSGRGLISANLKTDFLLDFARAGGMTVAYQGRDITRVSLSGSRAAIEEALACYKRRGIPDMAPPRSADASPGSRPSAGGGSANPPPEKKGVSSGTGFFVSREGHVLTNFHVVKGCRDFRVNRVGDLAQTAQLLAGDEKNDLALLKSSLVPALVPGLKARIRVGENISVYGFPLSGLLATTGNFTVGNVTAVAGIADDTRMLQISAPVQPGNSGGPLIDQTGNVVGVIVSKLNALSVAQYTKDLPQNVNFAIKASIAQNFLDTNSIRWESTPDGGKMLDSADIAERARQFTVRIMCE